MLGSSWCTRFQPGWTTRFFTASASLQTQSVVPPAEEISLELHPETGQLKNPNNL
jgi:hypothetical protein